MKSFTSIQCLKLLYIVIIVQLLYWSFLPSLPYPEFISVDNFDFSFGQFDQNRFLTAFRNSFLIFLGVCSVNLLFMLPLGYFLAKTSNPYVQKLSLALYLPILCPILLPALGLYEVFARFGLLGNFWGVILVQSSFLYPFMLKPIEAAFNQNGFLLEKIAVDLGESKVNIFFKVTCPLVKDAIGFGVFLTLIGSFNDYIVTFLIGDTVVETVPTLLYPLMLSDNRSLSSLSILIYTLPILLLVLFIKKKKV